MPTPMSWKVGFHQTRIAAIHTPHVDKTPHCTLQITLQTTHGKNASSCRGLFILFLITKLIGVRHLI